MILTGKNQNTQRKTYPTATLSPTNMTCPGLVWPIFHLIHNLVLLAILATETACLMGKRNK